MKIYKENWGFIVHMLWLLLENNSPKHFALKCVTYYVSYCSLQSDSVVIWNFFYSWYFLFLPLSWPADYKNTENTIWENMCWNQKKHSPYQMSAGQLLWRQLLGQIIKHNVFWQCLKSFFFHLFFNRNKTAVFLTPGEFIQRSNKL